MSEPQILKLVFVKGPRQGETLEFQPGNTVRIGRVIRGNTKGYRNNVVVKDTGISSEHVSIDFESGKWVVRDRNSSNGTILNDITLSPNTPFDLRHQDTLKIGERTSITVLIGHTASEPVAEVEVGGEVEKPRRGRPRKAQGLKSQVVEKVVDLSVDDSNTVFKVSPKKTRSKRNEQSLVVPDSVPLKVTDESGLNLAGGIDGKKRRAGTRRTKKNLFNQEPSESASVSVADNKNQPASYLEQLDGLNLGEVGSIDLTVNVPNIERSNSGEDGRINVAASDGKVDGSHLGEEADIKVAADKGNVVGSNLREEIRIVVAADSLYRDVKGSNLEEDTQVDVVGDVACVKVSICREETETDVATDKDNVERLNLKDESFKGVVSESCFEVENRNADVAKGSPSNVREEPDLEKMTLGEWFDYLEVHLPKQIIDETEELIENMRQKAKRVYEYRMQQMNERGKKSTI